MIANVKLLIEEASGDFRPAMFDHQSSIPAIFSGRAARAASRKGGEAGAGGIDPADESGEREDAGGMRGEVKEEGQGAGALARGVEPDGGGDGEVLGGGVADGADGEHRDAVGGAEAVDGGGFHIYGGGARVAARSCFCSAVCTTDLVVISVPVRAGSEAMSEKRSGSEKLRTVRMSPTRKSGERPPANPAAIQSEGVWESRKVPIRAEG